MGDPHGLPPLLVIAQPERRFRLGVLVAVMIAASLADLDLASARAFPRSWPRSSLYSCGTALGRRVVTAAVITFAYLSLSVATDGAEAERDHGRAHAGDTAQLLAYRLPLTRL